MHRLILKRLLRFKGFYLKLCIVLILVLVIPFLTILALDNLQKQTVHQKKVLETSMERLQAPRIALDGLLNDIEMRTIKFTNNNVFDDDRFSNRLNNRRSDMENELLYFYNSLCCVDSIYLSYEDIHLLKDSNKVVQEAPPLNPSDWADMNKLIQKEQKWHVQKGPLLPKDINDPEETLKVTLIRPIPSVGNQLKGLIVINLNSESLFKSPYKTLEDDFILAVSPDESYIFESKKGLPYKDAQILEKIKNNPKDLQIDDKKYSYKSSTSNQSKWKYIYMIRSDMLGNNEWIQGLWIMIAATVMFIGVIYAFYVTRKMFIPLNKLLDIFKSKEDYTNLLNKSQDEFSFLLSSISSLMKKETKLESQLKSNFSELRHWFLYQLITGSIKDVETMNHKMQELGIAFSGGGFFVFVFRIDDYNQFVTKYKSSDQELLRYFIAKLSEEIAITKGYHAFFINTKHRDIALICNVDFDAKSIEQFRMDMLDLAQKIHEHTSQYIPISASIGIGDYKQSAIEIVKSYNEALQVLEYRAFKSQHIILANWMVDDEKMSHNEVYLVRKKIEKEIELMQLPFDHEKLKKTLLDLQHTFEQRHDYPLSFIQHTFWELTMHGIDRIHNLGSKRSNQLDLSIWYQELIKLESIDQFVAWFERIILGTINRVEEDEGSKQSQVMKDIIQYIQLNFDKEISLGGIASHMKMDPSYLSKLIKLETGMSFMEYLLSHRLNKAKNLLINSDLNINQVSESVGYQNTHSFIRIFKKYQGVTPGQYRESNRTKKLDTKQIY